MSRQNITLACQDDETSLCFQCFQLHTFDHTLGPEAIAYVESVPGVVFHPLGITRWGLRYRIRLRHDGVVLGLIASLETGFNMELHMHFKRLEQIHSRERGKYAIP